MILYDFGPENPFWCFVIRASNLFQIIPIFVVFGLILLIYTIVTLRFIKVYRVHKAFAKEGNKGGLMNVVKRTIVSFAVFPLAFLLQYTFSFVLHTMEIETNDIPFGIILTDVWFANSGGVLYFIALMITLPESVFQRMKAFILCRKYEDKYDNASYEESAGTAQNSVK
jgi:hypothetical protein